MNIQLKFFAGVREALGVADEQVDVPDGGFGGFVGGVGFGEVVVGELADGHEATARGALKKQRGNARFDRGARIAGAPHGFTIVK